MQIVRQGIVYSDTDPQSPTRVASFPGLIRLSDGRLLSTYRVGSTKESNDENMRISVSHDEGQTWEQLPFNPDTSVNGVPGSLRIGHCIETKPGELLMMVNWMNRSRPDLPLVNAATGGLHEMKIVAIRSHDGGATWDEPVEITTVPFDQPEISGPLVALKEPGHFFISMENQKHYDDPNPIDERLAGWISRDYGASWTEHVGIVHVHGRSHWCNRFARLPESGRLIGTSWTYDVATAEDLPIHFIRGSADGREWEAPVSTGILGQLSTLFPLTDDTLLFGYVHRHQPPSIRLRASKDSGHTLDAAEELIIYSGEEGLALDGLGGDITEYYEYMTNYTFGWNPMVRLGNGNVLLVYFAGTTESTSVRCVEIDVKDLG